MNSLIHIQNLFYEAIFNGPNNNPAATALQPFIEDKDTLSSQQQINIYRDSILGSLATALSQIFPVCQKLVGDDFFNYMACQFIYRTHSHSPDLADYGEHFSDYIRQFPAAAGLPYLADVATLEWAWHRAFNAADQDPLDIDRLSHYKPQQQASLIFKLPVSGHLITSEFPIDKIWQVNQDNYTDDEQVDLETGGVKLLVWRQAYDMRIDALNPNEWWLLNAIDQHQHFTDICVQLEQHPDMDIATLMPQCVSNGWIADFCED